MELASLIVVLAIALAVIFFIGNAVRVIRQQRVGIVERLGKFRRTLEPGPIWWCRCLTRSATTWTCGRTSYRSRRKV